ncbi:MAG: tRNA lysidine(34) synthetase TilS [Elusimicrobia bacterium]|nr:tRNA lysidine(34) synthetase TilS [Elusimicrobiota bacterium]
MRKAEFHARLWPKLLTGADSLLRRGDRVLVAVSGGPDSVCLADFLARLRDRRRLEVRLAHFDHGLRRGSAGDARFVRALAERLGVGVDVKRLDVRGLARRERRSVEDAGRALRYRALERLARRRRCNKVATGHQKDDQAETVLLHLLRGTSAEGLAGIPERRPLARGIEVVRPLLALSRAEILEYLRYRGLDRREDPTNRSTEFLRNWVRHELLPQLEKKAPGVAGRLAAISTAIRSALRRASTRGAGARVRARSRARRHPSSRAS